MHTCILHVLRDGNGRHDAVTGHRVHVDLLCFLNELGDDYGVLLRDGGRTAQETLQVPVGVRHIHSSTAEHIGGAHYAGVPDRVAELASRLKVTELSPLRLADTDGI